MRKKKKICNSGIGGQAVLEGIMMKNKDLYAVAIRKPDGEIDVETEEFHGSMHGSFLKKLPFVRGIFNFWDSLTLGMKTLTHSASFYDEEEKETATDRFLNKLLGDKAEKFLMGCTVAFSLVMAVAIFMLLPYFLSGLLEQYVRNTSLLALIEGGIRIVIFLAYVVAISAMKDIRRVYQYHGAEHKCINCLEHGHILSVKNVKKSSRLHRRCGTSFLLFVMVVSVVLFILIRVENPVARVAIRVALIPVIAGISYEIIRLAGRSNNIIVKALSLPGMLLQKLTTEEPDEDMIEVAIKSIEAVFDWKAFLGENFDYEEFKTKTEEKDVIEATSIKSESTEEKPAPKKRGRKPNAVKLAEAEAAAKAAEQASVVAGSNQAEAAVAAGSDQAEAAVAAGNDQTETMVAAENGVAKTATEEKPAPKKRGRKPNAVKLAEAEAAAKAAEQASGITGNDQTEATVAVEKGTAKTATEEKPAPKKRGRKPNAVKLAEAEAAEAKAAATEEMVETTEA